MKHRVAAGIALAPASERILALIIVLSSRNYVIKVHEPCVMLARTESVRIK